MDGPFVPSVLQQHGLKHGRGREYRVRRRDRRQLAGHRPLRLHNDRDVVLRQWQQSPSRRYSVGGAKGAIHDFEAPAIGDASEVIISAVCNMGCVDPPHFAVLK